MRLLAPSSDPPGNGLRRAYAQSRRAHPRLDVPYEAFGQRAARATRGLANGDLYLAVACDLGRPQAWERLQRRFRRPVRAFLKRRGASATEAEQILDDVWGLLAEPPARGTARTRMGTYDGRGALASWLCTVAWRRLADLWRGRAGVSSLDAEVDAISQHDDPATRLAADETEQLLGRALEEAWAALTARELEALVLKYVYRLPQTQIAASLDVGAPRVTRLLQSATRRLREALEARFELRIRDDAPTLERAALSGVVERMLSRTEAELGRRAPVEGTR